MITKTVQEEIEGKPKLTDTLLQKIKNEPLDYQEGFRKGYIKEREKIRSWRLDVGCWTGALIGALLF